MRVSSCETGVHQTTAAKGINSGTEGTFASRRDRARVKDDS